MEIRAEKNDLDRRDQDVITNSNQIEQDCNDLQTRCQRAEQSRDSKLNNVRAVRGADFEQQAVFSQIMCEVEQTKNQHLLNALS